MSMHRGAAPPPRSRLIDADVDRAVEHSVDHDDITGRTQASIAGVASLASASALRTRPSRGSTGAFTRFGP